MKYYSETLKKLYNTEEDLVKAEALHKQAEEEKAAKEKAAKEARATRAKEVEAALKDAEAAKAKANKLLNKFVEDYGYFHTSYSLEDVPATDTFDKFTNDFVKQVFSFLGKE